MKAIEFLKQERAHHLAVHNDKSIIEQYDEAIKELEATATTQQAKTVTNLHTSLMYCPLKNSSCILSKCAAYTTHQEQDIMKCDTCGDTFYRGQRCKNYIKGKPDHIKMSLYKNMAYCKHFKQHVYINNK